MTAAAQYPRAYRNGWFRDSDKVLSLVQETTESFALDINWTRILRGDTIASVTWTPYGVSLSGTANTTTNTSALVTGVGELKITVTTAAGATKIERRRFYSPSGVIRRDYATT